MLEKVNIKSELTHQLSAVSANLGVLIMTAAAAIGTLEPMDFTKRANLVPAKPVFALSAVNTNINNPLRNERDEVPSHYLIYGIPQRTPSRSSKQ